MSQATWGNRSSLHAPTGLRPKAQGCGEAATLGSVSDISDNPNGVAAQALRVHRRPNTRLVDEKRRNPVGVVSIVAHVNPG